MVRNRVEREVEARQARASAKGTVYQPSDRYDVGQKLVFSSIGNAEGVVEAVRPGNNATYGKYDVLQVKLNKEKRDFAAGLTWEHALSQTEVDLDPGTLAERFAPVVAPHLAARLSENSEWLNYGDRWILKALLPEVNQGHRNLAEAVIMLAGEPLPASQILSDLGLDKKTPEETRAIALELSLAADERFRNVGALESPLWTLTAQL